MRGCWEMIVGLCLIFGVLFFFLALAGILGL
jgi:hypothetical protein